MFGFTVSTTNEFLSSIVVSNLHSLKFYTEPSLYTVKAVLILDNDGDRLYAKYYDDTYPTVKEQKAFEKNIFNKTHRTDSEIALLEGLTVVYKSNIDLFFYVIGSSHENEVIQWKCCPFSHVADNWK
uniref:Coatomer subunit zeta n=1 Tax=Astatotilapia calliptera TaxID=8154 RepID=A0AAX7UBC0_ASTCA